VPNPESNKNNQHSTRGKYFKPLREEAIRQIRRLIIEESYTPTEVQRKLKIPPRSFRRYMHAAFEPERQVLVTKLSDEEVFNQMAIMEARLTKGRQEVLAAARDEKMDPKQLMAIVEAHHLTEELAVGIFKIHQEAAPNVIRGRAHSLNKLSKLAEEEEVAATITDAA
jgi:AraC-like DNA-binding protein